MADSVNPYNRPSQSISTGACPHAQFFQQHRLRPNPRDRAAAPPRRLPVAGRLRCAQGGVARVHQPAGPASGNMHRKPKSACSRSNPVATAGAAAPTQNPRIRVFPNQPLEPRADRATRAKSRIRVFPNQPFEPRAGRATRAKPRIRVFPNQPFEPRADRAIRPKPRIRVSPNQPLEPRAGRATRANPRIRVFPNQPLEPRADRAARAKSRIRVFPNQPFEPRADRATRAKPQIRVFPNQPSDPAPVRNVLHDAIDSDIRTGPLLRPIALPIGRCGVPAGYRCRRTRAKLAVSFPVRTAL